MRLVRDSALNLRSSTTGINRVSFVHLIKEERLMVDGLKRRRGIRLEQELQKELMRWVVRLT